MSNIGDIIHGRDLGYTGQTSSYAKYIFVACPVCKKTKWTRFRKSTSTGYSRCQSCCGKDQANRKVLPHGKLENSPRWKGGRRIDPTGYIKVVLPENDPYYGMCTHKRSGSGDVSEHRLVMARSLGRILTEKEHIHHKNGIKDDNRLENLELISPSNHMLYDKMCSDCDLRKQIGVLRKEIKVLKAQLQTML
jgi:hypothetical protein